MTRPIRFTAKQYTQLKKGVVKKNVTGVKPVVTEKQLQDAILDYLNRRGHFAYRQNAGMFFIKHGEKTRAIQVAIKGASDIIGVTTTTDKTKCGIAIAIEVKRPGGKPKPEQVEYINQYEKRGAYAFVTDSLEYVMGLL